jgi:hypothetical protein
MPLVLVGTWSIYVPNKSVSLIDRRVCSEGGSEGGWVSRLFFSQLPYPLTSVGGRPCMHAFF